jgi:Asp-tRNA(Asn)/Glu-tRNA(Gln) amidotransferase A subunit family amidase
VISNDRKNSFPIGMMITGKKFDEVTVLNVAYAYEKLRDSQKPSDN